MPASISMRADVAVILGIVLIAAVVFVMWWNRRSVQRAQARLLHRDRLYAMLSHCNQAIVHTQDAETLLPRVCRIACEEGGFRLAWLAWVDDTGRISALARHGDIAYIDALGAEAGDLGRVPGDSVAAGDDPLKRALADNAHCIVDDVQREQGHSLWLTKARQYGFGSLGAFPIRFQGRTAGAFLVYGGDAGEFGRDELRLLDEVSGDVSFALDTYDREARRRAAEESLRETTHMLQTLVDASPLAIVVVDENNKTLLWSPAAERLFGWHADEVLGKVLPYVPPEDLPKLRPVRPDRQFAVERRRQRKDGSQIDVNLWTSPLQDANGRVIGTLGILADVSERRQFERQIRQSQKLDALGTIAGGIAHDFNNILTVLRGNLSLAHMTLPDDHAMRTSLMEMDRRAIVPPISSARF